MGQDWNICTRSLAVQNCCLVNWRIGAGDLQKPGEWLGLMEFLALNCMNLQSFFFLVMYLNFAMLVVSTARELLGEVEVTVEPVSPWGYTKVAFWMGRKKRHHRILGCSLGSLGHLGDGSFIVPGAVSKIWPLQNSTGCLPCSVAAGNQY